MSTLPLSDFLRLYAQAQALKAIRRPVTTGPRIQRRLH